eukprot:jgi/Bigna1/138943/aug1.47_g13651
MPRFSTCKKLTMHHAIRIMMTYAFQLANLFTVEDYYRRILDLYFTLRKQREHNFPELKTRFKISTGSGQNLFKINSQSCFEVFCGTGVYAMAYDAPISAALRSLANIYNAIRSNNMGDQVARALYFSRLSGPSRTSADNVENVLLLNPDLYANFRILVAETCLHSNLSVADMIIDYFLS